MTGGSEAVVATWRRSLLNDRSLSSTNKLVALALHDFWNADGDCEPWGGRPERGAGPTMKLLGELTGKSERTVIRALAELERSGYVRVTYRSPGRGSNRYVAAIPAQKVARREKRTKEVADDGFASDLARL